MTPFENRQLLLTLIATAVACLIGSDPMSFAQSAASASKTELAQMIDSLANRNRAPKVVEHRGIKVPLFADDYDWEEQTRARRALVALTNNESVELWEELLKHRDDARYSLTMMTNGASTENYSVGELCGDIAYHRLIVAFKKHVATTQLGRPVYLETGIKNLSEWRKKSATKALWQLQVEVCERAVEQVPRVSGVSDEAKGKMRERIASQIAELKRTKQAVFGKLPLDSLDTFTGEDAKRFREQVKSQ